MLHRLGPGINQGTIIGRIGRAAGLPNHVHYRIFCLEQSGIAGDNKGFTIQSNQIPK